jgi:Peptidase_C39 like family
MKHMCHLSVLILPTALIAAACLLIAGDVAAQPDAGESTPVPQQSTTGPKPPPGVELAEPDGVILRDVDQIMMNVPGYLWRHGCGPTALGMVVGYYDGQGYPNLVPGDASTQTSSVDQVIASQGSALNPLHYEDYCLPMDSSEPSPLPDRSELPAGDEHPSDSLADFMHTSWSSDSNFYGWSWSNRIGLSWQGYINQVAPEYGPTYENYWSSKPITWEILQGEIDNNRPMVFLVDSDGSGGTDHFVTVIGYRDTLGYQEYACLDTWGPASLVRWERLRPMQAGDVWGVWGGTRFSLTGWLPEASASVRADTDPTNAASVDFTVTFSESVTGVDAGDFALTTTGDIAGASVSLVSGSGTGRTVTVSTGSGDGTIRLDVIDDDTVVDGISTPLGGAGAGNGDFTSGELYTMDKIPPTAVIGLDDASPSHLDSIDFSVDFSEAVGPTFDTVDVTVTGSLAPGAGVAVAGSDPNFTVTVTPSDPNAEGTLGIAVGTAISDAAGNPCAGGSSPLCDIDQTYYSNGVGGGDFTSASSWLSEVVPGSGNEAEIVAGDTVTLDADAAIASLAVNMGADFRGGPQTLTIENDGTLNVQGLFTPQTGTVAFAGSAEIAGDVAFNDLTIGAGGLLVEHGVGCIGGALTNAGIIRNVQSSLTAGPVSFGCTGVAIDITVLGMLTSVEIDRTDSNSPNANGENLLTGVHWDITPDAGGHTLDLTLPFDSGAVTDPHLARWTGSEWEIGRTSATATDVTLTGVTQLSQWTVNDGPVIPVEISVFSAD